MSVVSDAERLVEVAVPGARGARVAVYAIGGLLVLLLLAFLVWWLLVRPLEAQRDAAQAKVNASLGTATGDITTHALPQINEGTRQKVEVDVQIQKGQIDVRTAPDARVGIGGVSDSVRRANCLWPAYSADPACVPLHEDPAGVRPAGPDPRRPDEPD